MIINVEALVAYDIDFPEEDDGPVAPERISIAIEELGNALDALLATAPAGEMVRDGAVVVIAGATNAGKSSLFNALLGAERAIVTDIPGTTRDAIEATIDAGRWPIRLVDTAGLRDTDDTVERMGIEVSSRYLAAADVVLACGETDDTMRAAEAAVALLTKAPVIAARTKSDVGVSTASLQVSARTGHGLRHLVHSIENVLSERLGALPVDAPILTRERHRHAILAAREEISAFARVWESGELPAPVDAVHLRSAAHALEDLVGTVELDDIFDRLFRTFCVGK